jgi:hypothetical protein
VAPPDDYQARVRAKLAMEARELANGYGKHATDTLVSQAVIKLHEIARSLEEAPGDTKITDELPAYQDPDPGKKPPAA